MSAPKLDRMSLEQRLARAEAALRASACPDCGSVYRRHYNGGPCGYAWHDMVESYFAESAAPEPQPMCAHGVPFSTHEFVPAKRNPATCDLCDGDRECHQPQPEAETKPCAKCGGSSWNKAAMLNLEASNELLLAERAALRAENERLAAFRVSGRASAGFLPCVGAGSVFGAAGRSRSGGSMASGERKRRGPRKNVREEIARRVRIADALLAVAKDMPPAVLAEWKKLKEMLDDANLAGDDRGEGLGSRSGDLGAEVGEGEGRAGGDHGRAAEAEAEDPARSAERSAGGAGAVERRAAEEIAREIASQTHSIGGGDVWACPPTGHVCPLYKRALAAIREAQAAAWEEHAEVLTEWSDSGVQPVAKMTARLWARRFRARAEAVRKGEG